MRKWIVATIAAVLALAGPAIGSAQLISEFQPNPPGTDPSDMEFEISGTPLAAFSGWVLSIECDGGAAIGTVDSADSVSGSFDANGLLVVTIPDLENPSFTVVLVDSFTGTAGSTDIDGDDDGTADDLSTFGTVYDAIGVPDASGDETYLYGAQLGGTDFAYTGREPEIVFRDYSTGQFYATNTIGGTDTVFDTSATSVPDADFVFGDPEATSFGALNPSTVVPVELQSFSVE